MLAAITKLADRIENVVSRAAALEPTDDTIAGLKRAVTALTEKVLNMERLTAPMIVERERERAFLVGGLARDPRVPFSQDELQRKPLRELRQLADMMRTADALAVAAGTTDRAPPPRPPRRSKAKPRKKR